MKKMERKTLRVALVGATGNVGGVFLKILKQRNFPISRLYVLASKESEGQIVLFGKRKLKVEDLDTFDFQKTDVAFFTAGASVSEKYAPRATEKGCLVIDNTSFFRMQEDVPLIIPEINLHAMKNHRGIFSIPNCSTIGMLVPLKKVHEVYHIKRIVVSTYQSTSGAGKEAQEELLLQMKNLVENEEATRNFFPKQIALNLLPHIDSFLEDEETKEEWKMREETKKILGSTIEVHANCVRVPTLVGHALFVNVELEKPYVIEELKKCIAEAEGTVLEDHARDFKYTSVLECEGQDPVFVTRLRRDKSVGSGFSFFSVSDNLRKGAALNGVQIAEKFFQINTKK